jgi:hypothetical protein
MPCPVSSDATSAAAGNPTYDREMVALRKGHGSDVVRITTAPESPQAEMSHRQKRYMISMAIRTACFVGAVVVGPGWLRWVLVAAALVLPYVAVVMANSASPRIEGTDPAAPGITHRELGGAPGDAADQPPTEPKRGTI